MILCQCNVILRREIEEVIIDLLHEDPWQLIVPGTVYRALGKRGKCCGCFPNVVDVIQDGTVQCVINTPEGRLTGSLRDGFYIRRAAAEQRIPCFTSIDTARAAIEALARGSSYEVATVAEYVAG